MQVFVALQSTHIEQRWRGINLKKNQNQTQQIKETERKGVERAKEKLKNIQSICTHVCKFTYTGILRRALPITLMSGQKFSCF